MRTFRVHATLSIVFEALIKEDVDIVFDVEAADLSKATANAKDFLDRLTFFKTINLISVEEVD